jgi:hypothetical protein
MGEKRSFRIYFDLYLRASLSTYYPNYLIRLVNSAILIVEISGRDTPQDQTKRWYLDECVDAVNATVGLEYGFEVLSEPSRLADRHPYHD